MCVRVLAMRSHPSHAATRKKAPPKNLPAKSEGGGAPKGASNHLPRQGGAHCRASVHRCGARPAGRARLSALRRGSRQRPAGLLVQLQAMLPGTRIWRALPAFAYPSPGKAPPAPAVVPA